MSGWGQEGTAKDEREEIDLVVEEGDACEDSRHTRTGYAVRRTGM